MRAKTLRWGAAAVAPRVVLLQGTILLVAGLLYWPTSPATVGAGLMMLGGLLGTGLGFYWRRVEDTNVRGSV